MSWGFLACGSFGSNDDTVTTSDAGSSSGSIADASPDAPPILDGGGCTKVAPFTQTFNRGDLADWAHTHGPTPTSFTLSPNGGNGSDGSIVFEYEKSTAQRRDVVEHPLPRAGCFELAIDFQFTHIDGNELVFSEVKFENDHLLGLAINTSDQMVIGQQDLSNAKTGFNGLATSPPLTASSWHNVALKLDVKDGEPSVTATIDKVTTVKAVGTLIPFDQTKSVEVGVSFVGNDGSGEIEIDTIAFR